MNRRGISPLLRSIIILSGVGIITIAATFASLQSQNAVLSSNTISTATASLLVSNDGTSFNNTKTGFTFSNVTPGGSAVPAAGYNFYLKNTGTANLSIRLTVDAVPTIPAGVDSSKVFINLSRSDNGYSQVIALKSLTDSMTAGPVVLNDSINAGTTATYSIKVSMAVDAYNGASGATISGVDLVFLGIGS